MGIVTWLTCHLDDWELGYWPSRKDLEDYRLHYLCYIYILNTLTSFGWHRTVHSPTRRRVIFGESQKYCNLFDACQYKSFDTMENISGRMDPYQIGMRIKISPSVITTTQWIYVMLVFMSWWLLSQNPVCNSSPAFRLLMRRGDCSVLNGFMDERLIPLARDTDGGLKVCIWPSNDLTRSKRSIRLWRRLFWPVILMLYLFIMEEIGRYVTKNIMENLKYKYFLCTKMILGISLPSKAMIDREHLRKQPY